MAEGPSTVVGAGGFSVVAGAGRPSVIREAESTSAEIVAIRGYSAEITMGLTVWPSGKSPVSSASSSSS